MKAKSIKSGSKLHKDDVASNHQFKIAKQTLRYSDAAARFMGGMSKDEARAFLKDKAGWSDQQIANFEK